METILGTHQAVKGPGAARIAPSQDLFSSMASCKGLVNVLETQEAQTAGAQRLAADLTSSTETLS